MDISLIFKIAAGGIIIAVLDKILSGLGREEQATMVTLAGLVVVLMMVIGMISKLFDSVKAMFQF
jgi:stage III sporulation protein AC